MAHFKLIFRSLQSLNYRLFFIGQTISLFGTWMQQLAMSWLIYRLTVLAVMILSFGLIIFSFSSILWISLLALMLVGFGMMIQVTTSSTIIQTIVEEKKRGRVMSYYTMAFAGMTPFGSLWIGGLANKIGVSYTLLIAGVFCLMGSFLFYQKFLKSYNK